MYDSCSQESLGLQAVLESALDANLKNTCRSSVHLGKLSANSNINNAMAI